MPPPSSDGFAPPFPQPEPAPPPLPGEGYDYDFSNEIMPSLPHKEKKKDNDDDDDDGEIDCDEKHAGEDQLPFNPDDYPGWVLDEASGAWYYAGDGEEEADGAE